MKKIIALAIAALIAALPLTAKTPKKVTDPSQQSTKVTPSKQSQSMPTTQKPQNMQSTKPAQTKTKPSKKPQTAPADEPDSNYYTPAQSQPQKTAFESHDFEFAGKTYHTDAPGQCTLVSVAELPNNFCDIPSQVSENGTTYTVTAISNEAFANCKKTITGVTIPETVTEIVGHTFRGCSALSSVTLPPTLRKIGGWAFDGTAIEYITLPESVTELGDLAFMDCRELKTVTLNCNFTSIGRAPFMGCPKLMEIYGKYSSPDHHCAIFNGVLFAFTPQGFKRYTNIPSTVKEIGQNVFDKCKQLTYIKIPDSVTKIDFCAFYQCSALESITIPASVTEIGENAFMFCEKLTDVKILNPNTTIGKGAFDHTPWGAQHGYK